MFDWQSIKTNSFFMRKVWTLFVMLLVLFNLGINQHSATVGDLYFFAGILIFLFFSYALINHRFDQISEKEYRYLQYLDIFLILLALARTHWEIPVSFIIYLSIMKMVLVYGLKEGLRMAFASGVGFCITYWFYGISQPTPQAIHYMSFSFVGMILTAVVSSAIKQQVKEMEDANVQLILRNSEMYTLQQVSNHVSSVLNIDDLFQLIPDILLGISGAKYVAIYLTEDGSFSGLKLKATNCDDQEIVNELFFGVCGYRIRDTFLHCKSGIENTITCGEFASMMSIPLRHKDELLGVMVLTHYRANAFGEKNLQLLEPVANQLATAIANARLYDEVKRLANLDGLTGVYNRKYFQDQLAELCKNSENRKVTLIMLDVDHFKLVNDTFGHMMGDQVLQVMTKTIEAVVADEGIVARYGGEEFVVLLPDKDMDQAYEIAEVLREEIHSQVIVLQDQSCQITVSIGVAGNDLPQIETMDDLLKAADAALYQAKDLGRNQTVRAAG